MCIPPKDVAVNSRKEETRCIDQVGVSTKGDNNGKASLERQQPEGELYLDSYAVPKFRHRPWQVSKCTENVHAPEAALEPPFSSSAFGV